MSKILFVVSRPLEINTSSSIRNKAMIEGLLANGHAIDLLTTTPNEKHAAYDKSLAIKGVRCIRIPMNQTQKLTGLCRQSKLLFRLKSIAYKWISRHEVYDHLKFIKNHTDYVDLSNNHYDYIISSSDPKSSHLFVLKLLAQKKPLFNGKWIQIWGDPFLTDITITNHNKGKIRAEEQRLLNAADCVFYVSRMTLEQQQELYPACAQKMHYTPIPYVREEITNNRDLSRAATIELAYCGDYGSSIRNLRPLYEAVNQSDNIHLTVCGGSDTPLQNTEKVTVKGRMPYKTVREIENQADILVFVANRSGTQIPGKIYQYSGANKPILFILDGNATTLREQFEEYHRFAFANNSAGNIIETLKKLMTTDKTYLPLKDFSKQRVMEELMNTITNNH